MISSGAWVFIELEHGRELEEKTAKEEKTQVYILIISSFDL